MFIHSFLLPLFFYACVTDCLGYLDVHSLAEKKMKMTRKRSMTLGPASRSSIGCRREYELVDELRFAVANDEWEVQNLY